MAAAAPLLDAFIQAQKAFKDKVQDPTIYAEILAVRSVDDLLKEAILIQQRMPGKRFMRRIEPFIKVLEAYGAAIDTFVSVKPQLLALIWGPIRVLLRMASDRIELFDTLAKALDEASEILPHIKLLEETFADRTEFGQSLTLFYKGLLDFYLLLISLSRTFVRKHLKLLRPSFKDGVQKAFSKIKDYADKVRFQADALHYQEARQSRLANQNALEVQAWLNLRSAIAPMLYDERISWLRSLAVPGCTDWLLSNDQFVQWLDPAPLKKEDTPAWLFLHGIPGAGKTHLAVSAVSYAQRRGGGQRGGGGQDRNVVVLFAFISHTNKKTLTAASVLQSLLFQVAENDQGLQMLLRQSKATVDLVGGVNDLTSMLQRSLKLLKASCYIVIDSLDEMLESQRQQLLHKLDEVAQACRTLRILVSSRAEADITRELQEARGAARICADENNHGSIAEYVEQRLQKWERDRPDLGPEGKSEVRHLIGRLPGKANGMFLYARIIFDNLDDMYELEQIRGELAVLPKDLDEAYHRILQRIHDKENVRTKCLKVLGWIECAPVPMTAQEMDQAIYIDTAGPGNAMHPVLAATNFVKLCGPIVEIADGNRLQFVHFTVPGYIFNRELAWGISLDWAAEELAACLLAYLASDVLDLPGLQDDGDEQQQRTIDEGLFAGNYRLLQYAAMQWPACVYRLLRPGTESGDGAGDGALPQPVRKLLSWLAINRANPSFGDGGDEASVSENDDGDTPVAFRGVRVENEDAVAHELLRNTFRFSTNEHRWAWKWSASPTGPSAWVDQDPLQTARVLQHVQQRLAVLATSHNEGDAARQKLVAKHDRHLFKCRHAFCVSSLRGFSTLDDLDSHEGAHRGRWQCDEPTCPNYLIRSYVTRGALREHILGSLALHPKHALAVEQQGRSRKRDHDLGGQEAGLEDLDGAEIADLLHNAIFHHCHRSTDEVLLSVQRLSALPEWKSLDRGMYLKMVSPLQERLMIATEYDFPSMKAVMTAFSLSESSYKSFILPKAVAVAIQSGDAPKARWALVHREDSYFEGRHSMAAALTAENNIYDIWHEFYCGALLGEVGNWEDRYHNIPLAVVVDAIQGVWSVADTDARAGQRLLVLLDDLKAHFEQRHLGMMFKSLVENSCSDVFAGKLLALGANINDAVRGTYSALRVAVAQASRADVPREAAVRFVRFLLRSGATDKKLFTRGSGGRPGRYLVCVERFEKRTGLSWERLVEEYRQQADTPMTDESQSDVRMVDDPTEDEQRMEVSPDRHI